MNVYYDIDIFVHGGGIPCSIIVLCYGVAYFSVHRRAIFSYSGLLVLYNWAISGTSGSSGLGSVSSEQMESST